MVVVTARGSPSCFVASLSLNRSCDDSPMRCPWAGGSLRVEAVGGRLLHSHRRAVPPLAVRPGWAASPASQVRKKICLCSYRYKPQLERGVRPGCSLLCDAGTSPVDWPHWPRNASPGLVRRQASVRRPPQYSCHCAPHRGQFIPPGPSESPESFDSAGRGSWCSASDALRGLQGNTRKNRSALSLLIVWTGSDSAGHVETTQVTQKVAHSGKHRLGITSFGFEARRGG
jgi:hypothetical protein